MPYVNESEYSEFLQYKADKEWRPIAEAPTDTWVEVIGNSGMSGAPAHFLCLAKHMPDYRPLDPWRDRQLDALSDSGWEPLFWRKPSLVPSVRP